MTEHPGVDATRPIRPVMARHPDGWRRVDVSSPAAAVAPYPPRQLPPNRIVAHGFAGFSAFTTVWVASLILIPYFNGNRLSWIHVVFALVGLPLVGYLWWVTRRMWWESGYRQPPPDR